LNIHLGKIWGIFFSKPFVLYILQTRIPKNSVWSVNYTHEHVTIFFLRVLPAIINICHQAKF